MIEKELEVAGTKMITNTRKTGIVQVPDEGMNAGGQITGSRRVGIPGCGIKIMKVMGEKTWGFIIRMQELTKEAKMGRVEMMGTVEIQD